jgi:hypothetical protein
LFWIQRTERIALWENTNLADTASEFAARFGLKPDAMAKLRGLLERERNEVLRAKQTSS